MSSTIEIKKICEQCGKEFIARKSSTRYCSKRCAEHAYKDKRREEHVRLQNELSGIKREEIKNPILDFMTPRQCATSRHWEINSLSCFGFQLHVSLRHHWHQTHLRG